MKEKIFHLFYSLIRNHASGKSTEIAQIFPSFHFQLFPSAVSTRQPTNRDGKLVENSALEKEKTELNFPLPQVPTEPTRKTLLRREFSLHNEISL